MSGASRLPTDLDAASVGENGQFNDVGRVGRITDRDVLTTLPM
jgi:hypothetical protein